MYYKLLTKIIFIICISGCNSIKPYSNNAIVFNNHGFLIELNEKWQITESNKLYKQYLIANKQYNGEKTEKRLKENSSIIFKASPINNNNPNILVTCFAMNLPTENNLLNKEMRDFILEKTVNDIYQKASLSKNMRPQKPIKEARNGNTIFKVAVADIDEKIITHYRVFISKSNAIICAGTSKTDEEIFLFL